MPRSNFIYKKIFMGQIFICVIVLYIVYWALTKEKGNSFSYTYKAPLKNKEENLSSRNYEPEYKNECSICGGGGIEYRCRNCYSIPTFSGMTEHYDGDVYCSECRANGKDYYDILEETCEVCNGTGKANGYDL